MAIRISIFCLKKSLSLSTKCLILVDIVNLFQIREHTWPHSTISADERIQQICIQSANEEQLLELITNRYKMYINKLKQKTKRNENNNTILAKKLNIFRLEIYQQSTQMIKNI